MIARIAWSQPHCCAQLFHSFVKLALINQHLAQRFVTRRKVGVDCDRLLESSGALWNHLFVEVCDAQVECGCEVRGIQFQRALEVFDGFLVVAQCCMRQSQIEDRQHVVGTEVECLLELHDRVGKVFRAVIIQSQQIVDRHGVLFRC